MAKGLLDSDGSGHDDDDSELQQGPDFKVNAEYARKFTHNKKREELEACTLPGLKTRNFHANV